MGTPLGVQQGQAIIDSNMAHGSVLSWGSLGRPRGMSSLTGGAPGRVVDVLASNWLHDTNPQAGSGQWGGPPLAAI
jgi:hypothetical protein